jgi:hypothetical protein
MLGAERNRERDFDFEFMISATPHAGHQNVSYGQSRDVLETFQQFYSKISPEKKMFAKQRHYLLHEPFWILLTIQRVDTAQRARYGSPHSSKSTTYATVHCKLSNAANWILPCSELQVKSIFRNTDIHSVCRSCSGTCMKGRVG